MKTTSATYTKDKYYQTVTRAVEQLLRDRSVITPVEVLMQIGYLAKEDYEHWRLGRVPYLERVKCNLSKANRVLRILCLYAGERGLHPSHTVYKKWGKGPKVLLRFSKSGQPALEALYSTHYIAGSRAEKGERPSPNEQATAGL